MYSWFGVFDLTWINDRMCSVFCFIFFFLFRLMNRIVNIVDTAQRFIYPGLQFNCFEIFSQRENHLLDTPGQIKCLRNFFFPPWTKQNKRESTLRATLSNWIVKVTNESSLTRLWLKCMSPIWKISSFVAWKITNARDTQRNCFYYFCVFFFLHFFSLN